MGYAIPRIVYGVYENGDEADRALSEISSQLQQNAPLRIPQHGNREFLIAADRVHYVVCDEVERPRWGVCGDHSRLTRFSVRGCRIRSLCGSPTRTCRGRKRAP
jgi:hypothetical protein